MRGAWRWQNCSNAVESPVAESARSSASEGVSGDCEDAVWFKDKRSVRCGGAGGVAWGYRGALKILLLAGERFWAYPGGLFAGLTYR